MTHAAAYLNVEVLFQKIMKMPLFYSTSDHRFHFSEGGLINWRKMPIWNIGKLCYILTWLGSTILLIAMIYGGSWANNIVQCVIYFSINTFSMFALVTVWTMENRGRGHCWLFNQQFAAIGIRKSKFSLRKCVSGRQHNFVYATCLALAPGPFTAAMSAFVVDFTPVEGILFPLPAQYFPIILRKVIGGLLNGFTLLVGTITCLAILLADVASVEVIQIIFKGLKPSSLNSIKNQPRRKETNIFTQYFHRFHHLHIEITQSNLNIVVYIPCLVAVGIILCVCGYYLAFTSFNRLPFLVYGFSVAVAFIVSIIIGVIGPLAAKLRMMYLDFIAFWKRKLWKRVERQELRSCYPLATSDHRFHFSEGGFINWRKMPIWNFGKLCYILTWLGSTILLITMIYRGTWANNIVQCVMHFAINTFSIFALVTVWTMENRGRGHCWLFNQQFAAIGVRKSSKSNKYTLIFFISTTFTHFPKLVELLVILRIFPEKMYQRPAPQFCVCDLLSLRTWTIHSGHVSICHRLYSSGGHPIPVASPVLTNHSAESDWGFLEWNYYASWDYYMLIYSTCGCGIYGGNPNPLQRS
ncbi:unnamed protein product [Orchesella dallaii]|uniref:Uncharacterized protein n=1 Tax=Orchesella dallaii TaxID=48710 RepID=A0ABP1RTB5_9HEXA